MTTFQPRQSERGRCVHRKAGADALQNHVTNRTTKMHSYFHEARKIWCNHFQRALQEHVNEWSFYTREALPLVKTRILRLAQISPLDIRSPARQPRDGREISGKTSAGISCAMSAQLPGNGRSVAKSMPPDGWRDNRRRAERFPVGNRRDNLQSANGSNAECPVSLRRANLPESRRQLSIHDIQKL
jgi:hypothetical protein